MSANSSAIVQIRDASMTDADALVEIFKSPKLSDDGTAVGRLRAVLDATAKTLVPGLQTGIEFGDTGFRTAFLDPWPSSANQVGHFLTAVGLSFNPAKISESFMGRRMRDWLGAPSALSDEDVAIRLCIGHEESGDPHPHFPFPFFGLWHFRDQYAAATDADVRTFMNAGKVLGSETPIKLRPALAALRGIQVDPTLRGNSYQDLLLTLCGWRLGKMVKNARFQSRTGIAAWIKDNISV